MLDSIHPMPQGVRRYGFPRERGSEAAIPKSCQAKDRSCSIVSGSHQNTRTLKWLAMPANFRAAKVSLRQLPCPLHMLQGRQLRVHQQLPAQKQLKNSFNDSLWSSMNASSPAHVRRSCFGADERRLILRRKRVSYLQEQRHQASNQSFVPKPSGMYGDSLANLSEKSFAKLSVWGAGNSVAVRGSGSSQAKQRLLEIVAAW